MKRFLMPAYVVFLMQDMGNLPMQGIAMAAIIKDKCEFIRHAR